MPVLSEQFAIALSEKIKDYTLLESLCTKYSLTLFTVLSPGNIINIDKEVSANPHLANEAVSLVEMCSHLSLFYAEPSFDYVNECIRIFAQSRAVRDFDAGTATIRSDAIQPELMSEYNINTTMEAVEFLNANPILTGVYIFVACWHMFR